MSLRYKTKGDLWDPEEEANKELERIFNDMHKAVKVVQNEAKVLCPVDSGRLRNSILTDVTRDKEEVVGVIETNVEYAGFVHDGTGIYTPGGRQDGWSYQNSDGKWFYSRGQKPQPFLKNALENKEKEVLKILQGDEK